MRTACTLAVLLTSSCALFAQERLQVGDVLFDPLIDDPGFTLCNETQVAQYYNFGAQVVYKDDKPALKKWIAERITPTERAGHTGFVTIRFIVNCEGQAGRFRSEGMSMSYQPKSFDRYLTQELIAAIREYKGWGIASWNGVQYDYYHYLTFKLEDGRITGITP